MIAYIKLDSVQVDEPKMVLLIQSEYCLSALGDEDGTSFSWPNRDE